MQYEHFHGSYYPDDVVFLLKPIDIPYTEVGEKERLIQDKRRHYSEMLSPEYQPSQQYLEVFHSAFKRNKNKLARHALSLAGQLARRRNLVLVSLARAGTPIGVLLKRILREVFGQDVPHYTISIIRDRGIDENALHYILQHSADPAGENIAFIDGWTGKGVIARELKRCVKQFNIRNNAKLSTDLYVIADICGEASQAATQEDYLIPSSLLNSTVSGLISRSILNTDYIGPEDFHGCKFYTELREYDLSLWYIEQLMQAVTAVHTEGTPSACVSAQEQAAQREKGRIFVESIMKQYRIDNINLVKPGVGEAIRVLLRRVPERILVRSKELPEIQPFLVLAAEKGVPVEERPDMPYQAVGVIAGVRT